MRYFHTAETVKPHANPHLITPRLMHVTSSIYYTSPRYIKRKKGVQSHKDKPAGVHKYHSYLGDNYI